MLPEFFFEPEGDGFVATELTRGPWDNRFQHGGPPAALLVGALDRLGGAELVTARASVALLRPVPIGRAAFELDPVAGGRTVQRLGGRLLLDGQLCLEARVLRVRRADLTLPEPPPAPEPWPAPESLDVFEFPFFQHQIGYHRGVEVRIAHGAWGRTPIGCWARPRAPLVPGRDPSPIERVVLLADAQSGMGVPLDPRAFSFVNPDLTVYVTRDAVGDWIGFDIVSTAESVGIGLAQSALRDLRGALGRSAQSLVVRALG